MKKLIVLFILLSLTSQVFSQNKMGNTWVVGIHKMPVAVFNGIQPPAAYILKNNNAPAYPFIVSNAHSNICDSATGQLLFLCNGMRIYDTSGSIMQNGDSLQYLKVYTQNNPPDQPVTQGSIILPKGSNGEYYVFIPTVTDSLYSALWTPDIKTPFNELRYSIVNMNLNGGLGAVTVKNKSLLKNTEMVRTKMQACRHANGIDWWLLKQTGYGPNNITRFLVTKDSIYGPYTQNFVAPDWGQADAVGQIAFCKDGKKFASVQGKSQKLFLADFDRCSGELSNSKIFNIPIDSTNILNPQPQYIMDSANNGVCFSPNGKFAYITRRYNIYQFEYDEPDSNLAWVRIQHGPDTSYFAFQYYSHLYKGPDSRLYIGNVGGQLRQFSVIDYPDNKGIACGFCRKCFRIPDSSFTAATSPPNMPDYVLGADLSKPCWPLSNEEFTLKIEPFEVYPNPSSTVINIKTEGKGKRELYNSVGQLLFFTGKNEINVSRYSKGIYYIKIGNMVRKVIIE
jgi:hypothetical protein